MKNNVISMRADVFRVALFFFVLAGIGMLATDAMAQNVQFSKMDTLFTQFLTWVKNKPLTIGFTLALIVTGVMGAFNRLPWMWFFAIVVGAFVAFGSGAIVTGLKNIMS